MLYFYRFLKPYIKKYTVLRRFLRWVLAKNPWIIGLINRSQRDIYDDLSSKRTNQQVFFDVTHLSETGLKTGIQRVVLSLYEEIKILAGDNYDVSMIALSEEGDFWHFRYYDDVSGGKTEEIVVPREGDVFLGVDLNALVIHPIQTGLFDDWKERGAKIVFTVHDMLPVTNTEWWPLGVPEGHAQWVRSILSVANQILSVSETTQNEVLRWAREQSINVSDIEFSWFHLGADFDQHDSFDGETALSADVNSAIAGKKVFLHVSTFEPRKGHADALDAFDSLWQSDDTCVLIFVGKEGWHSEQLVDRIKKHPLFSKNLIWLTGISDKALKEVYEKSDCLINPSYGEGFGLSLIEAAHNGLPIIARDIPIFREVLGDYGLFFTNDTSSSLEITIRNWLIRYGDDNQQLESREISINSWNDAAYKVCRTIELEC